MSKHKHHWKSIPRRIDESLKRPPKTIFDRADQGWNQLAKDVRHFRTLSVFHQVILILILVGATLVIASVMTHWFGFVGWF